jgi:DNA-binding transcriptional ArsR family regulator
MTETAIDPTAALQTRMIKALGHPLRQRILQSLNNHESSPSTLANELGEPIGKVAYHVKILLDHDAIELVRTQPVRGAVEHFYRAIERPYLNDEHWSKLPASVRRSLFDQTLQQVWEHVVEGAEAGGFDATEAHVSWTTLDLDPEGYEEVVKVLNSALARVVEIQAEAAGRLVELPDAEKQFERTEVAIMHYHRPGFGV